MACADQRRAGVGVSFAGQGCGWRFHRCRCLLRALGLPDDADHQPRLGTKRLRLLAICGRASSAHLTGACSPGGAVVLAGRLALAAVRSADTGRAGACGAAVRGQPPLPRPLGIHHSRGRHPLMLHSGGGVAVLPAISAAADGLDEADDTPAHRVAVIGGLMVCSFVWQWLQSRAHADASFFLLPGRCWEFLAGGLVFLLRRDESPTSTPSVWRTVASHAGLVMVLGAALVIALWCLGAVGAGPVLLLVPVPVPVLGVVDPAALLSRCVWQLQEAGG